MPEPLSIDAKTSALLVMDFQVVLLERMIAPAVAEAMLGHTVRLLAAARAGAMPVIHVKVGFRPGYPEVSPRNTLFSSLKESGLLAPGSAGAEIHPAVAPKDDEAVVIKHRVSAFHGTDLDMLLRARGTDTLVLAGFATSGVVLSTLRYAFDLDYRMIVARDCCADPDETVHTVLLDHVIARQATICAAGDITIMP